VRLLGYGESSDGTNMSTPPKDGAGAAIAISRSLDSAGLTAGDIDYVNLHGTATPVNDSAEANAIRTALSGSVPASSVKGMMGHTLGAAGAIEAIISILAIEEGIIPGNVGLDTLATEVMQNISPSCRKADLKNVLSNSFGFGGSNCSLVLGY
jgi:3-oxoacyl-[acyl-carrier-protein] synthase-1